MSELAGKSVLFVDDEELLREVMNDWLVLAGAQVSTAPSSVTALELAKSHAFDAVITDFRMPGKSGLWLVEQIRSEIKVQPKIFICSGFNDLTSEDVARLDIAATFSKPFDESKIIKAVAQALLIPPARS